MTKPHVFSDFDGTITETDTLVFLATRLGGGADGQRHRAVDRRGQLSLRDGIAAEMRSVRKPFVEAERLLRKEVRIDAGFAPLARWGGEKKIPLTVLSAGFHQIIDLFISRDEFPNLEILANHIQPNEGVGWQCRFRDGTGLGTRQSESFEEEARRRGEYVIFIGDGLSDHAAAEAADEVFAKHSRRILP